MIEMLLISLLLDIAGKALSVCFVAALAYYAARMGRKGWKAGE